MIQGSDPDSGKRFFFSLKHPDWVWGHPASFSLTAHQPKLGMGIAIPPLSLYASWHGQG